MIAAHPEVQQKLNKEIKDVLDSKIRNGLPLKPTYNDIKSMPYLTAVVHETQRLCPIAHVLARETQVSSPYTHTSTSTPTLTHTTPHHNNSKTMSGMEYP